MQLTIGEQSERVGVVQGLLGIKLHGSFVSISKIVSARSVYTGGVAELMESGGGLVLSVALSGEIGKHLVVEIAVGDDVLGRQGIGKDVWLTVAENILAVVDGSGRRVGGLGSNSLQAAGDLFDYARVGRLKIFLDPGITIQGGLGGLGGEPTRILECGVEGTSIFTARVAFNHGALYNVTNGALRTGSLQAIDVHLQVIGLVVDGAYEGSSVIIIGKGNSALGIDDDGTTHGQVCGGSDVENIVESLTRLQCGEGIR